MVFDKESFLRKYLSKERDPVQGFESKHPLFSEWFRYRTRDSFPSRGKISIKIPFPSFDRKVSMQKGGGNPLDVKRFLSRRLYLDAIPFLLRRTIRSISCRTNLHRTMKERNEKDPFPTKPVLEAAHVPSVRVDRWTTSPAVLTHRKILPFLSLCLASARTPKTNAKGRMPKKQGSRVHGILSKKTPRFFRASDSDS